MEIILHRRNSLDELLEVPTKYGVEIDIRSYKNDLILSHDPFKKGEFFSDWIVNYNHGTLIINVKEEGLEERVFEILDKKEVNDFFFLDQSFPFMLKYSDFLKGRSAVRISEYESIETAKNLIGKVDWIWLDCFSKFPLRADDLLSLKESNFKLCIVSPELQGRDNIEYIKTFIDQILELNTEFDAVCTKFPDLWKK